MSRKVHSMGNVLRTALVLAATCGTAAAHAWPDKPVRIVVGFAAGGAADLAARVVAEQMQKKTGQTVTIENRAGAGGRLATDVVAKAEPDGHTLALLVGGDTVLAASDPKLPYNLLKDFQFVSTLSVYPFVLVAGSETKPENLKALIDAARRAPGVVKYATPGRGTTQHLAGELIASTANVDIVDIPYKGSSAAMTDLITGRVDFTIAALNTVRTDIQAGKLKALGVTSKERVASLPAVPAIGEVITGYEVSTWMGIAAPARTPQPVVEQIHRVLVEIMAEPHVRERFVAMGLDPVTSTPAEMRARVEADVGRWKQLLATRKIDLTQ